jgi:hypothetical protein
MEKSFFFVRTHIDENCRAESRKGRFNEETMLEGIREECLNNLEGLNVEVFLISNYDPDKWDFPRLRQSIKDVLPLRQKEALTLALTTLSKDEVKKTVEMLRGKYRK